MKAIKWTHCSAHWFQQSSAVAHFVSVEFSLMISINCHQNSPLNDFVLWQSNVGPRETVSESAINKSKREKKHRREGDEEGDRIAIFDTLKLQSIVSLLESIVMHCSVKCALLILFRQIKLNKPISKCYFFSLVSLNTARKICASLCANACNWIVVVGTWITLRFLLCFALHLLHHFQFTKCRCANIQFQVTLNQFPRSASSFPFRQRSLCLCPLTVKQSIWAVCADWAQTNERGRLLMLWICTFCRTHTLVFNFYCLYAISSEPRFTNLIYLLIIDSDSGQQ